ncbi:hypothetical protein Q8A73_007507 [Channa argus]|nr:hypothetical protein Q8A73_007507 [Channa argus]
MQNHRRDAGHVNRGRVLGTAEQDTWKPQNSSNVTKRYQLPSVLVWRVPAAPLHPGPMVRHRDGPRGRLSVTGTELKMDDTVLPLHRIHFHGCRCCLCPLAVEQARAQILPFSSSSSSTSSHPPLVLHLQFWGRRLETSSARTGLRSSHKHCYQDQRNRETSRA